MVKGPGRGVLVEAVPDFSFVAVPARMSCLARDPFTSKENLCLRFQRFEGQWKLYFVKATLN